MQKSNTGKVATVVGALALLAVLIIVFITLRSERNQMKVLKTNYTEMTEQANVNFAAYESKVVEFKIATTKINTNEESILKLEDQLEDANYAYNQQVYKTEQQDSVLVSNAKSIKILQESMKVYFKGVDQLRRDKELLKKNELKNLAQIKQANQDNLALTVKLRFAEQFIPKEKN